MRSLSLATGVVATAALLALAPGGHADTCAAGSALPLRTVARVPLSGASVRFDYTSLDPRTNELWISHMDAGRLLAVDVRTRRMVKTIAAPVCMASSRCRSWAGSSRRQPTSTRS